MSQTRIQFSAIGERWVLELIGGVPESEVEVVNDIVSVVRDAAGRVVEMLIDFSSPPDEVIAAAIEAFGQDVEAALRSNPIDDLDTVVGGSASLVRPSEGVMPARRASINISIIKGEPGVPVPKADHSFDVVLESPTGEAPAVVDRDVDESRIRVSVEADAVPEGSWLRIADGETGTILALGEIQPADSSSGASVAFALDIPTQALHFSATDDPLTEPGTRRERRRRWARETELLAEAKRLRQPKVSTQLLRRAVEIYEAIGDHDGSKRCRQRIKRLETGRRARWATGALLGIGALAVGVFSLTTDTASNSTDSDAFSGPVYWVHDDIMSTQASIIGSTDVVAGGTLTLEVQARITVEGNWGDETSKCSQISTGGDDGNRGRKAVSSPFYTPVLTRLDGAQTGNRALETFAVEQTVFYQYELPENCRDDVRAPEGGLLIDFQQVLTPYEAQLKIPGDLEPGYWVVTLTYQGEEPTIERGSQLVFRVVGE